MAVQIDNSHAQTVVHVAANRFINADGLPGAHFPVTVCQCPVFTLYSAFGNLTGERIECRPGARHHHESTGIFVQPVHDTCSWKLGGFRVAVQQGVEQRPSPIARGGVHHQSGWLVEYKQVRIFVHDIDGNVLWHESGGLGSVAQCQNQPVAGLQARSCLGAYLSISGEASLSNELLQVAA